MAAKLLNLHCSPLRFYGETIAVVMIAASGMLDPPCFHFARPDLGMEISLGCLRYSGKRQRSNQEAYIYKHIISWIFARSWRMPETLRAEDRN